MGNIFAYMRISTKEDREMQKFSRQEVAIDRYAEENNLTITLKLKEDKSGKTFAGRTEWERMESLLHEGDTIIIKDISRFSRNVDEGVAKYLELMDEGVDLVFLTSRCLRATQETCWTLQRERRTTANICCQRCKPSLSVSS